MMNFAARIAAKPTSGLLPDGIVWGHANRDGHHSTVFRDVRVLSQIGYSIIVLILCAAPALATPLFDDQAVLDVTLTGPVSTLIDDKEGREELPFTFTTGGIEFNVDVRLRGHSRVRVCRFPPLRLDFRRSETAGTEFAGLNKLKLVTHCRHHDQGEQDLLEEYAAYRIFNVLTEKSYRARLLRINYIDTDAKLNSKSARRYAFLLEPRQHFSRRVGAATSDLRGVPKKGHDLAHAALTYVFQYMIGNTDWGFVKSDYDNACCHNGDLFEIDSQVVFVPYDFDLSGLVNARYAFPDPSLRIDRVTQRLYRGICTEREYLQDALRTIKARQADILATLQEIPGITKSNGSNAHEYLNSFFRRAANEDKLLRSFEQRCL